MDKKEREDAANFIILHAYTAASMSDGSDEMTDFEMLDQVQQDALMKVQRLVCKALDVRPEDFSLIGTEDIFAYRDIVG
tara:strand:+ start:15821 stop:16057 length:237 start_codon:yes stop_codon:yes gene_type:complete